MNYIWAGLILLSFATAVFTGNLDATTAAAFDGTRAAIEMCISLLGIMALWTGIMKIGEKSGLIEKFAKLLSPLTRILFPKLKKNSAAMNAIVMNMMANMLGMSNAATPLGLKAMTELDKLNNGSKVASNEMVMFVVINTASIQLIPSTLIALRLNAGSANPGEIIVPIWIASLATLIVGVTCVKIFQRIKRST
ncbi:MAG: nucleoside recognition protein [Oscillospiraceae bacterium]|nr:nucleoside recognition protein [Oscillospiraceae bacterium]